MTHERIYIKWTESGNLRRWSDSRDFPDDIEYVRADYFYNAMSEGSKLIAERDAAQAENAQLKVHLDRVLTTHDWHTDDGREASDAAFAYLNTLSGDTQ